MRKEDVPQDDAGVIAGNTWFTYAQDADGRFDLVPSVGWEPLNAAILEWWQHRDREAEALAVRVHAGELSPIAYWMYLLQMDEAILAPLVGVGRWRVRRHRRARVFAKLEPELIERYARAFRIDPAQLTDFPAEPLLPTQWCDAQISEYDARLVDPADFAGDAGDSAS